MSQIYSKTAKGQEEIKTRTGNINPRMRQALIFIDGKRSRDDLYGMLRGDDLDQQLKALVDEGYVVISGETKPAPVASPAAATPVAAATPQAPAKAAAPVEPPSAAEIEARNKKRKQEEEEHEDVDAAHHFMSKM